MSKEKKNWKYKSSSPFIAQYDNTKRKTLIPEIKAEQKETKKDGKGHKEKESIPKESINLDTSEEAKALIMPLPVKSNKPATPKKSEIPKMVVRPVSAKKKAVPEKAKPQIAVPSTSKNISPKRVPLTIPAFKKHPTTPNKSRPPTPEFIPRFINKMSSKDIEDLTIKTRRRIDTGPHKKNEKCSPDTLTMFREIAEENSALIRNRTKISRLEPSESNSSFILKNKSNNIVKSSIPMARTRPSLVDNYINISKPIKPSMKQDSKNENSILNKRISFQREDTTLSDIDKPEIIQNIYTYSNEPTKKEAGTLTPRFPQVKEISSTERLLNRSSMHLHCIRKRLSLLHKPPFQLYGNKVKLLNVDEYFLKLDHSNRELKNLKLLIERQRNRDECDSTDSEETVEEILPRDENKADMSTDMNKKRHGKGTKSGANRKQKKTSAQSKKAKTTPSTPTKAEITKPNKTSHSARDTKKVPPKSGLTKGYSKSPAYTYSPPSCSKNYSNPSLYQGSSQNDQSFHPSKMLLRENILGETLDDEEDDDTLRRRTPEYQEKMRRLYKTYLPDISYPKNASGFSKSTIKDAPPVNMPNLLRDIDDENSPWYRKVNDTFLRSDKNADVSSCDMSLSYDDCSTLTVFFKPSPAISQMSLMASVFGAPVSNEVKVVSPKNALPELKLAELKLPELKLLELKLPEVETIPDPPKKEEEPPIKTKKRTIAISDSSLEYILNRLIEDYGLEAKDIMPILNEYNLTREQYHYFAHKVLGHKGACLLEPKKPKPDQKPTEKDKNFK